MVWEGGRAEQEQRTQQTSPGWLSFPQHRTWLVVTVPQPVLAQALTAPASRAVQAVPWSCVVACRACSHRLPPVPIEDKSEMWKTI